MQNKKPAPGDDRAAGYTSGLDAANYSPKLSENQAHSYAQRLGGDHLGDRIVCPGPGHSKRDRSLSVRLDSKAPDGFLVHSFAGDDFAICRDHVKGALGLQTRQPYSQPIQKPAAHNVKSHPTDNSRPDFAKKIWADSRPLKGSLAERYLASRGIALGGNFDYALRFHPACPFGEGQKLPAMIALFRDIRTDAPCGVHRTALTPDGRKIDRKMLGKCADAAIKLSPDHDVTLGLGIAEGIETALSVMQAGLKPVWALGGKGSITSFPVMAGIECLSIFADHDFAGMNAAKICAERWYEAGREVHVVMPRIRGADFNDGMAGSV